MRETLNYFVQAHKHGRKHMKTIKADTAVEFGLHSFADNVPKGWRLEIGEKETENLLKLCERLGVILEGDEIGQKEVK